MRGDQGASICQLDEASRALATLYSGISASNEEVRHNPWLIYTHAALASRDYAAINSPDMPIAVYRAVTPHACLPTTGVGRSGVQVAAA
ncbi:hypothetical protein IWW46_006108, partial [Coemansia sp. RSA 2440]